MEKRKFTSLLYLELDILSYERGPREIKQFHLAVMVSYS